MKIDETNDKEYAREMVLFFSSLMRITVNTKKLIYYSDMMCSWSDKLTRS